MGKAKPDAVATAADFSLLNVIKADYKMQQRQKEIVSVISDMSAQMSQSIAKTMQSFVAQVDGSKPVVSGELTQSFVSTSDKETTSDFQPDFKGDVSAQIMEVHGSRVKKYGIFLDQIVDKIKVVQHAAQDLFNVISVQTAALIDIKPKVDDEPPDFSIAQAAVKLGAAIQDVTEILESFYEEEQILFQAGVDMSYQEQQVHSFKFINDAILANLQAVRQHLHLLSSFQKPGHAKARSLRFQFPGNKNRFELIEMIVAS